MKTKDFTGKLIAVDMYNCSDVVLNNAEAVEEMLAQSCKDFCMSPCQIIHNSENDKSEYSLFAVCNKGHVTIHIYPEVGFATADVFSCYTNADPAGLAQFIRNYLDADKSKITLLDRGDFGSESDMKPHRRSNIKFIRRTQNLGGKLKKMMMKPRSI